MKEVHFQSIGAATGRKPDFILQYKDDPPEPVHKMTRSEFLASSPQPRGITINGEFMPVDDVACDSCNEDPGDEIYSLPQEAICKSCFEKYRKFCTITP